MAGRASGQTGRGIRADAAPDTAAGPRGAVSGWQAAASRSAATWRATAAAAVLAAATVAWAAAPLGDGEAGTKAALIVAAGCAVLSVTQLAVAQIRPLESRALGSILERLAGRALSVLRSAQWAEGMLVAVLALAALRPASPWDTAVLGVLILAYLFAVHLAETGARPGVLRPQLTLIAAGLVLLALAAAAAELPGLHSGAHGALIRGIAIVAAIVVAAISVPATWARRR